MSLFVLLFVVAAQLGTASVPNPRASDSWVSDGADMISSAEEAKLNELGETLHRSTGLELAVVTVEAVDRPVRAFALDLFNDWGVGDARFDNGLLFFVAKKERALESVVGDGLHEVLPDAWLEQMQNTIMIDRFKKGDYGGGLIAGVEEVERYLRNEVAREGAAYQPAAAPTSAPMTIQERARARAHEAPAPRERSHRAESARRNVAWGLGGGGLGLLGLSAGLWWQHKRWRTCRQCKLPNVLLDEAADDAFLDAGQRKEEQIGSVDYQVFYCQRCDKSRIRRKSRWRTGHRRCPSCRYLTRRVVTTTLSHATHATTGSMRVNENCQNCSFSRVSTRTIPRLADSSSSSSSGRSYGGGKSSGGGASSRW